MRLVFLLGYSMGHSMVHLHSPESGVKFELVWVVWASSSLSKQSLLLDVGFHYGLLCPSDLLYELRDDLERRA